jgi:DNA (cytosine-5)-methyltransferase 1
MNVLSLFSGIGGLDLGLERAGMTIVGQVEIDPWCRKVLAKHWPEVPRHDDVRTAADWWLAPVADTEGERAAATQQPGPLCGTEQGSPDAGRTASAAASGRPRVDLVCGGFPCQPVSLAGKGLAQADSRWLWPAFAGVIRALRPAYVLVENVPGLLGRGMGDVLGDLAGLGYDAEWDSVPAAFVGAPHIRNRVWIVAYPQRDPRQPCWPGVSDEGSRGRHPGRGAVSTNHVADATVSDGINVSRVRGALARQPGCEPRNGRRPVTSDRRVAIFEPAGNDRQRNLRRWPAEPGVGRVAHGIPARVDRLRGLGNAVVPQVAEHIGRLIMAAAA